MRTRLSAGMLAAALAALPGLPAVQAQSPASGVSIAGAWTRNSQLSDAPVGRGEQGPDGDRGRGERGGGGRRRGGGGGGGGFGGGLGRGGGMGRGGDAGGARENHDDVARMRDAMRDVTNPSDHLIITQTDSMIVLTGADGRTTRLAPDGRKIKDDNTRIERKTKWEGGKLVSEINGLGPGRMTQTFAVDPERRQLRITLVMDGGRSKQTRSVATQVFDADPR